SGGSSVLMTCAALGLLLRVSYEYERAARQVAKLRGVGTGASVGTPPATSQPPMPADASARGTSRLRQRMEPSLASREVVDAIATLRRQR
ncbi:MAG: hypothetical protein ACMG50_06915, partial [Thermomonas sp.]